MQDQAHLELLELGAFGEAQGPLQIEDRVGSHPEADANTVHTVATQHGPQITRAVAGGIAESCRLIKVRNIDATPQDLAWRWGWSGNHRRHYWGEDAHRIGAQGIDARSIVRLVSVEVQSEQHLAVIVRSG